MTATNQKTFNTRLKKWLRPPRRLSFTTSGWLFVLMTLGVGFAAINTGNNLLFLMLGMMLSLILASGILSEAVIRSLHARRMPPRRLHVDQSTSAHLELINSGRWASLSIEVSERNPTCNTGPLRGRYIGPTYRPWWKLWKRKNKNPGNNTPVALTYCLQIPGRETLSLPISYTLPARGLFDFPGLNITTRFPFGLFEKTREIDAPITLTVFPRVASANDWITSLYGTFGEFDSPEKGSGEGFYGLREYREGEDRRLVHWKSSARRGELVVRENESHEQRSVEIFLMNCTGQPPAKRHLFVKDFEAGLEKTTGLLLDMHRQGYQIAFRTLDKTLSAANSESHLEQMLYLLATVELKDNAPSEKLASNLSSSTARLPRLTVGLAAAVTNSSISADKVLTFDSNDSSAQVLKQDLI